MTAFSQSKVSSFSRPKIELRIRTGQSVHGLKGIEEHAIRRANWDKGFQGTALQAYAVYIKNRGEEFVDCLKKRTNEDVNLSLWCSWLAFDIMGDIGFGEGFGMMEKAETHHYMAVRSLFSFRTFEADATPSSSKRRACAA